MAGADRVTVCALMRPVLVFVPMALTQMPDVTSLAEACAFDEYVVWAVVLTVTGLPLPIGDVTTIVDPEIDVTVPNAPPKPRPSPKPPRKPGEPLGRGVAKLLNGGGDPLPPPGSPPPPPPGKPPKPERPVHPLVLVTETLAAVTVCAGALVDVELRAPVTLTQSPFASADSEMALIVEKRVWEAQAMDELVPSLSLIDAVAPEIASTIPLTVPRSAKMFARFGAPDVVGAGVPALLVVGFDPPPHAVMTSASEARPSVAPSTAGRERVAVAIIGSVLSVMSLASQCIDRCKSRRAARGVDAEGDTDCYRHDDRAGCGGG